MPRYYAAFPALHGKDPHSTPTESESVWKNNPITKPRSGQTGEVESESPCQKELPPQQQPQQEQLSPRTPGRKKKRQTVRKLHARRTPSRREEPGHTVCRFLSWPNESLVIPDTQIHSLQDQELCFQVENMLKEILLQKEEQAFKMPCPKERMMKPSHAEDLDTAGGDSPRGSDGSVSPELQEDDSWYTQPIDILFTSEEPRQRLYKRNNSSSASSSQQRSGSNSPASPSNNQQSLQDSLQENQFLFPVSTYSTKEKTVPNSFPADLHFSLFNQSDPKAIPCPDSALSPDPSGFNVLSPFGGSPLVSSFKEREERHQANSILENISNSVSLTTVSDLEDMNKGVEDLDLDADCTSPENLLDHPYIEEFMNNANDQEVFYWNENLQSFDDNQPWTTWPSWTMATTWPSKVLVDDIMPEVTWDERYDGYSADFYNHLKLGKIWQVWDVNYQKIIGAYSSPWKGGLQTCWSDHGLFGMSNYRDPDGPDQTDIWGGYGIGSECTSWGDFGKLKDSYKQSLISDGVYTHEDNVLLEEDCNPLVMVDVDQDSVVCQLENQNSELIPQIQFDLVSEVGSEYDNVLSDGESDQISNSEDDQSYGRCASYGDFQTMWSMVEHSTPKKFSLSRSFELVPSEGSAFVDVVPKKLHHVQSEPNLVTPARDSVSCKNRSCKSDSSSPEEHLYFSQKTHFQPIQSPVAQYTGSTFNLRDLFGGYAPSKTPYQKFQKTANYEDEDDEKEFVPMFKIRKDQDKYIQTSSDCEKEPTGLEENHANLQEMGREGESFDIFEYVDNLTESVESTPQNLLECVNNYADSGYEDLDQYAQDREEADRTSFYGGLVSSKKNMDPWSAENGFYSKDTIGSGQRLCDGENWQSKMYEYVSKEMPLDTSKENPCFCGMDADAGNWQENASQVAGVCRPPVHQWVIQEAWGLNPGSGGHSEASTKHSIWSSGNEDGAFSDMFYYPGHEEDSTTEQFNMDKISSPRRGDCSEENNHRLFPYNDDLVSAGEDPDCSGGGQLTSDQPPQSHEAESEPYGQSFMEMTSYFNEDFSATSEARPDQQCTGQLEKENLPPQKESDIVKVKLVIKKGKKKQDFENDDTRVSRNLPRNDLFTSLQILI